MARAVPVKAEQIEQAPTSGPFRMIRTPKYVENFKCFEMIITVLPSSPPGGTQLWKRNKSKGTDAVVHASNVRTTTHITHTHAHMCTHTHTHSLPLSFSFSLTHTNTHAHMHTDIQDEAGDAYDDYGEEEEGSEYVMDPTNFDRWSDRRSDDNKFYNQGSKNRKRERRESNPHLMRLLLPAVNEFIVKSFALNGLPPTRQPNGAALFWRYFTHSPYGQLAKVQSIPLTHINTYNRYTHARTHPRLTCTTQPVFNTCLPVLFDPMSQCHGRKITNTMIFSIKSK